MNLKKVLKSLRSVKAIIAEIVILALLGIFIIYKFIPLPEISDGYMPDEARKVSYNAPLTVHFSQPMNRQSVESNFSIKPGIQGDISWPDAQTLEFKPLEQLNINDEYRITIASEAKSMYMKPLGIDFTLRFIVSGPPYVKFISPFIYKDSANAPDYNSTDIASDTQAFSEVWTNGEKTPADITSQNNIVPDNGQEEVISPELSDLLIVPNDQVITVMFDRPLRELTTISASANQNIPQIEITPPVKGTYRWIGTTAFQFIPEEWTMGTTYSLKIPKGITTLDGGKTEEDTEWKLATEEPQIISSDPYENSDTFSVNGNITVQFNQQMELDYIQPGTNVLLYPSNDADAEKNPKTDGFFNTEVVYGKDKDGKTDKSILLFKPEFPYLYDKDYKLVFKSGLKGAAAKLGEGYGDRVSPEDFVINFRTVKKPGIVNFAPKNGDQNYADNYVKIDFASPMTKELLDGLLSVDPEPANKPEVTVNQIMNEKNETVWEAVIAYNFDPSTNYTFELKGPVKDSLGNTLEKGFKTSLRTSALRPYMTLLANNNFGLFMNQLGPVYTVRSININSIDIEYCGMGEKEFFDLSRTYGWYNYHCQNPEKKTIGISGKLNSTNYQDIDLRKIFGDKIDNGIYFFQVSSAQYTDERQQPYRFYQTFFVSDTNLAMKKSGQDMLVWATDLKTGKPVQRMDIKVMSYNGTELQKGVTDGSGIYKISREFEDNIYVVGTKTLEKENRWSIVSQYWSEGIQGWEFGLNGQWVNLNDPRIYLYTERPIYRPGDEVFFKGIYRIDKDAKLHLPSDKKIRVALEDPNYSETDSRDINVLADGSFSGSFKLSDKASLGQYNLYAETPGQMPQRFYTYFYAEEYKKPQFKVEVMMPKTDYYAGDQVSADISANYYFGGAISGADVKWSVMRESYIFDKFTGGDYYSFGVWRGFMCFWSDCGAQTSVVAEGTDNLDKDGKLHLVLPKDENTEKGQSYLYTLNAEVRNKDGETVAQRDTFISHMGSFYIGLSPKNYIAEPGGSLQLKVITVSPDSKPVGGKNITLELYREKWNTVKKQGVDGNFYDESERELIFVKKQSVTSAMEPVQAEIQIDKDAEGGGYVIQGKAESGNILSETNFYVSSGGYVNWGSSNNNQMQLSADQPEYFIGGKAKIMIKSPFGSDSDPAKALITYERAGIQHYEVIDIKSNSDVIEVPIDEDMVPNIYVTVMVVKGSGDKIDQYIKNSKAADMNARINTLESEIAQIKSDTNQSDVNRNKVLLSKKQLELNSLRTQLDINKSSGIQNADMVDYSEIKPDFRLGMVNLPVSRREHQIYIDLKTSKDSYTVKDKVSIDIHTKDYQNRPVPAIVSLAVVDESVLALKANQKVDPIEYFYGQRALQVNTSSNLTIQMDRTNINSQQGAKGGGGGQEEGFDKKRGDFKDTAYFNPVIKTDSGGYAKIEFDPPDNLTTWQMWAVASADNDKFGMITQDFVVKKPLALTPILPRFVVSGDKLNIGALIHNQTGKNLSTSVSLKATGLTVNGSLTKSVSVSDGASERVDFQVTADKVSADADAVVEFTVKDHDGLFEDTAQFTIPLQIFSYPETVALNGTVDDSNQEKVRIPTDIEQGLGGLTVRIGGSLLTKFLKAFEALAKYPYGCAEQLTSQIMPSLVVINLISDDGSITDILKIDRAKSMDIINNALQKIAKFQRFDGGYGFWEGSYQSNPVLTAYVLYAQNLAMETGITVDQQNFKDAMQYLWNRLNEKSQQYKLGSDDRAFVLWALSESGQNDTGMTLSLFEDRKNMSLYAQALMLMNLENLYSNGQKSVGQFIEKLKSEIVSKQIVQDRTVHFEEANTSAWDMNTDRRTTAMILMALNRNNSGNPLLPDMINYFVTSMQKGALLNTQETAWELMAIIEYAKSQDILNPDFSFSAKLNGQKYIDDKINSDNINQIFEKVFAMGDLLSGKDVNSFDFQKNGTGQMNYDMELKYYMPNENVQPLEKGFFITRNYYDFNSDNKNPVTVFKSDGVYRGELNIIVPEDMYYAVVEERLPAGFEGINFNLETTDTSLKQKLDEQTRPKNGDYYWYDNPLWHFNHTEIRDDRVLLFADYLPRGVYTYNFLVRAGLPGTYHHLPASAYEMYFPEVFGRTGGEWVEVKQ